MAGWEGAWRLPLPSDNSCIFYNILFIPTEILELILKVAWLEASTAPEREELCDNLSLAHPFLRELIFSIAILYPTFECNPTRTLDFALYRTLVKRDNPTQTLFKNSHLALLNFTAPLFPPISARVQPIIHPVLARLPEFVGDCKTFTLCSRDRTAPAFILDKIASFPSLVRLHFDCVWDPLEYPYLRAYAAVPPNALPNVTFVHLRHYPSCDCGPDADGTGNAITIQSQSVNSAHTTHGQADRKHADDCLFATFLPAFPNLRHLHLDNPIALKLLLNVPRTLERLTLEAPSSITSTATTVNADESEIRSALEQFKIASALRRGFMRGLSPTGRRKKIVIRTSMDTPVGWVTAQVACIEAGVDLVRVIVYLTA